MPRSKEQIKQIRQKTRANIVNSALKLFSQKGFHGTSISDIAKEAGVSKGLAYNYFDSKQHLLEAIFETMIGQGFDAVSGIDDLTDPYDQLQFLINNSFSSVKDSEELWRLYMGMAFQSEVLPTMQNMVGEFTKKMFIIIEKIFRKIGFKNVYVEAMVFSATLDGLMLYYLVDPQVFPLEKIKKMLLKKYSKKEIMRYLDN